MCSRRGGQFWCLLSVGVVAMQLAWMQRIICVRVRMHACRLVLVLVAARIALSRVPVTHHRPTYNLRKLIIIKRHLAS